MEKIDIDPVRLPQDPSFAEVHLKRLFLTAIALDGTTKGSIRHLLPAVEAASFVLLSGDSGFTRVPTLHLDYEGSAAMLCEFDERWPHFARLVRVLTGVDQILFTNEVESYVSQPDGAGGFGLHVILKLREDVEGLY